MPDHRALADHSVVGGGEVMPAGGVEKLMPLITGASRGARGSIVRPPSCVHTLHSLFAPTSMKVVPGLNWADTRLPLMTGAVIFHWPFSIVVY